MFVIIFRTILETSLQFSLTIHFSVKYKAGIKKINIIYISEGQ